MKIKTGYRTVRKSEKPNKNGFYTSIGSYHEPNELSNCDVSSLLYGLDNMYHIGAGENTSEEMVVERYVDGNELKERKVTERHLAQELYKTFGKSVFWKQWYLTEEISNTLFPEVDWEHENVFRVWIVTKNGIVRKDVKGTYDTIKNQSEEILKASH